MSGDDIVERLRHVAWLAEEGSEVVDLATTAADEIVRLRAERDASRLIISDLTAEAERLRAAGDRLAAAVNAVACSGPRDEMAELTAAYIDWETRRG